MASDPDPLQGLQGSQADCEDLLQAQRQSGSAQLLQVRHSAAFLQIILSHMNVLMVPFFKVQLQTGIRTIRMACHNLHPALTVHLRMMRV